MISRLTTSACGRAILAAFAVMALLYGLASCASLSAQSATSSGATGGGAATATAGAFSRQGTLAGDVVAGPTCPVERAEDPCPPKPVPNREVRILNASGAQVATAMTDAKGHFSVALDPGVYAVTVSMGQGLIGMRQVSDVKATVVAGQQSTVKIELDTGIR